VGAGAWGGDVWASAWRGRSRAGRRGVRIGQWEFVLRSPSAGIVSSPEGGDANPPPISLGRPGERSCGHDDGDRPRQKAFDLRELVRSRQSDLLQAVVFFFFLASRGPVLSCRRAAREIGARGPDDGRRAKRFRTPPMITAGTVPDPGGGLDVQPEAPGDE